MTDIFDEVRKTPTEPQSPGWPESDKNGTVSEAAYLQRCLIRIGTVGRELDMIKNNIKTEADARKWLEFKKAVSNAKAIKDPYKIIDPMKQLEKNASTFASRLR